MSRITQIFCRVDAIALAAPVAVFCICGCGSNRAARYVPDAAVARQALAAALTAWKEEGGTSFRLEDETAVEVVDRYRRPGQVLSEFNILGEVAGDGGRWFEVELRLANPRQTEQARYIVVGIDPLWVFRQTDYEMLGHWDHPMPAKSSAKSAQSELVDTTAEAL
jgi:hypothetical protein